MCDLLEARLDQAIYWYERTWNDYFTDATWVKNAVENGLDPEGEQEYVDTRIAEQLPRLAEDQRFDAWRFMVNWYPVFGHVDRYYEVTKSLDLSSSTWTDADWPVFMATIERNHAGFTAQPIYLHLAELQCTSARVAATVERYVVGS